jgi:DNA repair protein RecO (recombination protein O)
MLYVAFEKALLEHLGFGLDLKKCAVTGAKENLIYISPKTGRAVCEAAGLPYSQKLFPMTHLLSGGSEIIVEAKDFQESLRITGYFLKNFLLEADLPPARNNLAAA